MNNTAIKKPSFEITQPLSKALKVTYYSDSIELCQGGQIVVIDLEAFEEISKAISERKPRIIKVANL